MAIFSKFANTSFIDFITPKWSDWPKQSIKYEPPPGVNIDNFVSEDEPTVPFRLERIGLTTITDHVSIVSDLYTPSRINIEIDPWLALQLTYNQRYIMVCNMCWIVSDRIGEIIRDWRQLENSLKAQFSELVVHLIEIERAPGDFGQPKDFKTAISPGDFGLNEYDC